MTFLVELEDCLSASSSLGHGEQLATHCTESVLLWEAGSAITQSQVCGIGCWTSPEIPLNWIDIFFSRTTLLGVMKCKRFCSWIWFMLPIMFGRYPKICSFAGLEGSGNCKMLRTLDYDLYNGRMNILNVRLFQNAKWITHPHGWHQLQQLALMHNSYLWFAAVVVVSYIGAGTGPADPAMARPFSAEVDIITRLTFVWSRIAIVKFGMVHT